MVTVWFTNQTNASYKISWLKDARNLTTITLAPHKTRTVAVSRVPRTVSFQRLGTGATRQKWYSFSDNTIVNLRDVFGGR